MEEKVINVAVKNQFSVPNENIFGREASRGKAVFMELIERSEYRQHQPLRLRFFQGSVILKVLSQRLSLFIGRNDIGGVVLFKALKHRADTVRQMCFGEQARIVQKR